METNQKDSVKIFLEEMARYPLLTHEEETTTANTYQRYRKIELLKDIQSIPVNSILVRYTEITKLRELESLKHGRRITIKEWATIVGITDQELKDALFDGRTQWAILTDLTVEGVIEIEREGLKAKNLLMRSNIRLVVSIARKYLNRGLEFLDLIQEGMIGMNRAIELFDPSKSYRFSTYAYQWIRQGITRGISSMGREIRLPLHAIEKITAIKKTRGALLLAGKKGSIPAIADAMGEKVEKISFVIQADAKTLSLDKGMGKDQDLTWVEAMQSPYQTPEELLEEKFLLGVIPEMISKLDDREQKVIILRYGLIGEIQTLVSIGKIMNLSRERIRQIERNAMKKLRAATPQYQEVRQSLA